MTDKQPWPQPNVIVEGVKYVAWDKVVEYFKINDEHEQRAIGEPLFEMVCHERDSLEEKLQPLIELYRTSVALEKAKWMMGDVRTELDNWRQALAACRAREEEWDACRNPAHGEEAE